MTEPELQKTFTSILTLESNRRQAQDLAALDKFVEEGIAAAAAAPPSAGGDLPEWHLVIIESQPPEFRLRSPYWCHAAQLRGGYLVLSPSQIQCWSGRHGVKAAAFDQAQAVAPVVLKSWATPGGHLERLVETAVRIDAVPESKRNLFILGFLFRYLSTAHPLSRDNDDKVLLSALRGNPIIDEDLAILFKLDHLKKKIRDAKEDFSQQEIMHALDDNQFSPHWFQRTRWWRIDQAGIENLGRLTLEASPPGATAQHQNGNGCINGKH